jgi:hypothetical protein
MRRPFRLRRGLRRAEVRQREIRNNGHGAFGLLRLQVIQTAFGGRAQIVFVNRTEDGESRPGDKHHKR